MESTIDQVAPPVVPEADAKAAAAVALCATGALVGPAEVMAIWRISKPHFHRLNRLGEFDSFLVRPSLSPSKCFSGKLITRYLGGDPVYPTSSRRRRDRG